MPIPLIVLGALAAGTALGIFGTASITDTAEDVGEAATRIQKLLMTTAIVGGVVFIESKTGLVSKTVKKVFK